MKRRLRNSPPRKRGVLRGRGGFTLLELLIVGSLGTLIVVFISNAWIWYARTSKTMQVNAHLNRELKLAAAAIAQDFGPALAARTTDGTDLQFDYDLNSDSTAQWTAPDNVVEYSLNDGKLVRHDTDAGTDVPMATSVTAIAAEVVDGHLNVRLTATYRATTQELTLQLRDPA